MENPADQRTQIPLRIQVMVGSPNRVNQSGQAAQVAEQNTAAVAGSQCSQSAAGPARPRVPQVAGKRQADDMNDTWAERQLHLVAQRPVRSMIKAFQRGE
jgi:hypothetical protein